MEIILLEPLPKLRIILLILKQMGINSENFYKAASDQEVTVSR